LTSGEIRFDIKKQEKLSFCGGFVVNCSNGSKTPLGMLEQIIIFSLFTPTQHDILKLNLQKLNDIVDMKISHELVETVVDY
jgi:hypothetical protein